VRGSGGVPGHGRALVPAVLGALDLAWRQRVAAKTGFATLSAMRRAWSEEVARLG